MGDCRPNDHNRNDHWSVWNRPRGALFQCLEGLHPNLNQLLVSPIHWLLVVAGVQTLKSKWSKAFTNSLVISGLSIVCVLLAVSGLSEQNNIEIVLLLTPIYVGFSGGLWLAKGRMALFALSSPTRALSRNPNIKYK